MAIAATYLATLVALACVDLAWLTLFYGPKVVSPALGDILLPHANIVAGIAFYLVYPIGLLIFAIMPGRGSWQTTVIYGALFGFFTYATYDITNYATLRNWTLTLTIIDVAWGTFVAALATAAGGFAIRAVGA